MSINPRSLQSKDKFEKTVTSKGGIQITPYITSGTNVTILCARKHTFVIKPDKVRDGQWCHDCFIYNAQLEFENIVKEKKGKILGVYKGTNVKILIECQNGHTWNPKPCKIKMGQWCQECIYDIPMGEYKEISRRICFPP